MKRILALLAAGLMAVAAAPATDADATHTVELALGESASVEGGAPGGINPTPFIAEPTCGDSPDTYCETVHIALTNPVPEGEKRATATFTMDVTSIVPGGDFDLFVYESDESGKVGAELGSSGNGPLCAQLCATPASPAFTNICDAADECVTIPVSTFAEEDTVYVMAHVVYFASPSGYTANVSWQE